MRPVALRAKFFWLCGWQRDSVCYHLGRFVQLCGQLEASRLACQRQPLLVSQRTEFLGVRLTGGGAGECEGRVQQQQQGRQQQQQQQQRWLPLLAWPHGRWLASVVVEREVCSLCPGVHNEGK